MKRQAQNYLKEWIQRDFESGRRKPLMIRGARQVGKTTLVKIFCEEEHLDLININLEQTPLKSIEQSYDVKLFLQEVQIIANKKLAPNSILFLDEIQASPKTIVMLRYLYEEYPQLPIISAGSLLEFTLNNFPYSIPVGRIEYFYLGPMNFEEYLMAQNESILIEAMNSLIELETVFKKLEHRYREFLFVGGMPAAIKEYIATSHPDDVRRVHREILSTYRDDINKYTGPSSAVKTNKVFDRICGFLGTKIKYSELLPEYLSRDIKKAISLLAQAKIITLCYHTNASGVPLEHQKDESVFKIFYLDIGLYNTEMGTNWNYLMSSSESELLNKGIISEQFVAQHLSYRKNGLESPHLFYWLKDKKANKAEVDFIIESRDSEIVPIEVKSGSAGHLKSLSLFMGEKKLKKCFRLDLKFRAQSPLINVDMILSIGENKLHSKYELTNLPIFQVMNLNKL